MLRLTFCRNAALSDALSQAETFMNDSKSFMYLTLYEQRLQRNLHKDFDLLRKLQREAAQQQAENGPHLKTDPRSQLDDPAAT